MPEEGLEHRHADYDDREAGSSEAGIAWPKRAEVVSVRLEVGSSTHGWTHGLDPGRCVPYPSIPMSEAREIELVFEPLEEGGYHVYAPDLPGLHTQGDDIDDASRNAEEALALYVEGLRDDGGSLDTGVIRRKFALPA